MKIATVTITKRPNLFWHVAANLTRQTQPPGLAVVVAHTDSDYPWAKLMKATDEQNIPIVRSQTRPEGAHKLRLGDLRNHGFDLAFSAAGCDLAATMDDDDWYGPGYLATLAAFAEKRPRGHIFGRRDYPLRWVDLDDEHETVTPRDVPVSDRYGGKTPDRYGEVDWVAGATIAIRREVWFDQPTWRYPSITGGEDGEFLQQAVRGGAVLFSPPADEDFFAQRCNHDHTWQVNEPGRRRVPQAVKVRHPHP